MTDEVGDKDDSAVNVVFDGYEFSGPVASRRDQGGCIRYEPLSDISNNRLKALITKLDEHLPGLPRAVAGGLELRAFLIEEAIKLDIHSFERSVTTHTTRLHSTRARSPSVRPDPGSLCRPRRFLGFHAVYSGARAEFDVPGINAAAVPEIKFINRIMDFGDYPVSEDTRAFLPESLRAQIPEKTEEVKATMSDIYRSGQASSPSAPDDYVPQVILDTPSGCLSISPVNSLLFFSKLGRAIKSRLLDATPLNWVKVQQAVTKPQTLTPFSADFLAREVRFGLQHQPMIISQEAATGKWAEHKPTAWLQRELESVLESDEAARIKSLGRFVVDEGGQSVRRRSGLQRMIYAVCFEVLQRYADLQLPSPPPQPKELANQLLGVFDANVWPEINMHRQLRLELKTSIEAAIEQVSPFGPEPCAEDESGASVRDAAGDVDDAETAKGGESG